ncbi:GntR family transcriptional regulator [Oerskovia turbata]
MTVDGVQGPGLLGNLERSVPVPLHDQISAAIRAKVQSGEWPVHYKLHAETDLAAELAVSRGTVRRALRTLIDEGLLRQVQGRGTFVAGGAMEQDFVDPLRSMAEDLDARGISYSTEVLAFEALVPPRPVSQHLDLAPEEKAWRVERLRRSADGRPIMLLRNWVSRSTCPGLTAESLRTRGLFKVLEDECGVAILLGRRTINAQAATAEVAERLEMEQGEPVLHVEQITYTHDDLPLEFSDVWTPPERISMSSVVRRSR